MFNSDVRVDASHLVQVHLSSSQLLIDVFDIFAKEIEVGIGRKVGFEASLDREEEGI